MSDVIDIIVPVYKNIELVEACLNSLRENLQEISTYHPRLVVINDSPDDEIVSEYLKKSEKMGFIDVLITNSENIGFVRSVNIALDIAKRRNASAILVNSDTVTFCGTLKELIDVAMIDEQIGFVCPRSNNASICTFPITPHARAGLTVSEAECYGVWKDVYRYLPRYSFSPTAVGFYMLIVHKVLQDFGGLDEIFDVGYEEENDLVMRANKVGFRSVLANHAYAYHAGSASFLLRDMDLDDHRTSNLKKMMARHPEFLPLIGKYQSSPDYRAETMLKNMVPDSQGLVRIILNLRTMTPIFNGTNELILNVLDNIDKSLSNEFHVDLLVHPEVEKFHELHRFKNLRCTNKINSVYAIAVCFGQPYDLDTVNVMEMLAPINVFGMLDVISYDCGYLRIEQNMEHLWQHTAETANGIFYISQFSKKIFENRFDISKLGKSYARLLPTKISAYSSRYGGILQGANHIIVVGNHFEHKDSTRAALQLSNAFPSMQFVVMGSESEIRQNVTYVRSGKISDRDMIKALAESSVVVLPSYYEGFGFSIMHALALGKPIVARDIPVTREILATFGSTSGIILFSGNDELPGAVAAALAVQYSKADDEVAIDWGDWTRGLVDFLHDLLDSRSVLPLLKSRIKGGDVLRKLHAFEMGEASNTSVRENVSPIGGYGDSSIKYEFLDIIKLSDQEFLDFLYRKVLGREPDVVGYNHYLTLLDGGGGTEDGDKKLFVIQGIQKIG